MYMFERLNVVRLLFWTVQNSRNHLHIWREQWLSVYFIRLGIADSQPAEPLCFATMGAVFSTSNNIFFKIIYPLEQKLDGWHQGKTETMNCSNHSIQISKMALHYSHLGILKIIPSLKPYLLVSWNQATWRLRMNKNILFWYQRWPRTKRQS